MFAGRLQFELLTVFLGVTGAFLAENYRRDRDDAARAQQFYREELVELNTFDGPAAQIGREIDRRLGAYDAARARGELAPPPYYREPRAERPPSAVWDAALASGKLEVIDQRLFYGLANFYNRVRSVGDRYQRYNQFTEQQLLPRLDDPRTLYERRPDGTVSMRAEYRAHVAHLIEIRDELRELVKEGLTLEARVRQLQR